MLQSKRQLKLLIILCVVPLSYIAFPFFCGFCNLSQGCLMLLAPIELGGFIIAGFAAGAMLPGPNKLLRQVLRAGIAVFVWTLNITLFFIFPPAAETWTIGFSTNFQITKHPIQVQKWAVNILDRYEAGQLNTSTNAPYWAMGKIKLNASEIPSNIGNLWYDKPSIGIAEVSPAGWITGASHDLSDMNRQNRCVAFSWYLTGILVGRPDFLSTWNPWYIREIEPGIYVYCGMK